MAEVRASQLRAATTRASAVAANLGIVLTDEQADEAGRRLLKQEQAGRAAEARASLALKRATRNSDFAIRMAGEYAQRYLDLWGSYTDADIPAVKRATYEAARVELYETPDGFKASRLLRRLDALLNEARARAWATTAQLEASLPDINWNELPTADDIAAEEGIAPWAAR